jgi:hypothetical protein
VTVGLSIVAQFVIRRWQLALDCSSDQALATTTYRQRFFLRVAFIDAAALVGFTLSFTANSARNYGPSRPPGSGES